MDERMLACHVMLLRLAGWLADDAIAQCRAWLAEERLVDLARTVAHAARLSRVRLSSGDLHLLEELYELDLVEPGELALLDTAEFEPIVPVIFASTEHAARTRAVEPSAGDGVLADAVEHALVGWAAGAAGRLAVLARAGQRCAAPAAGTGLRGGSRPGRGAAGDRRAGAAGAVERG
jgi:hypothetical protein